MSNVTDSPAKLSLMSVVLMNINVTLGSGIFINTVLLSSRAGALSGLTYVIVGFLLLPLIFMFGSLLRYYPSGGFYVFAQQGIAPIAGFISAWSYFVGKLASASLAIHVAILLLQTIFSPLAHISTLVLDMVVIFMYTLLNMFNIKQGSRIQAGFIVLKMFPIFFIIIGGAIFFNPHYFGTADLLFTGLPSTIPLALFTFYGFEAACSISMHIANSQKNAARAVVISHLIAVCITFLFQTFFYASLGSVLAIQPSYLSAYPAFILKFFSVHPHTAKFFIILLHAAVASSALGASYGIMYGNAWNLYTLAKNNHTFFSRSLSALSKNHIAIGCVMAEAFICVLYLVVSRGQQLILQQLSVFSLTTTFMLSAISFLLIARRTNQFLLMPLTAVGVCFVLLGMCVRNFFTFGFMPLMIFGGICTVGLAMYFITRQKSEDSLSNFDRY